MDLDANPPDLADFEERELCPDGACTGILGPDRRCKVCGLGAEGSRAADAVAVVDADRDAETPDTAAIDHARPVEQIFQELRRAQRVAAKRGPRGGYYLARPPEAITLGDVIRAVQGPIELYAPMKGERSATAAVEGPARRSSGGQRAARARHL